MSLRDRFTEALKNAMRARDQKRVSTLRLVLAALKERDIAARSETNREGVGDEEILSLLARNRLPPSKPADARNLRRRSAKKSPSSANFSRRK